MKQDILKALERGGQLCADLRRSADIPDLSADAAGLESLKREAKDLDALDSDASQALYLKVRWAVRKLALKNPLVFSKPILFLMRPRYAGHGQMLYEYVGWYYRSGKPRPDAGVFVL